MKLSLAVLCCAVAAASFGTTLYVSSTAAGGGDGSEANPYTMSEAWKNVKANDTIQLADGTYVEEAVRGDKDNACFTVRDKSNITFQGNVEHPENVIIDFNGTSNRGFYSPNQPFTVRGITFQNKKTGTYRGVIAAGGTINGTALVENCRFVNITTDQTSGDARMGTVFLGGATADFVFRNCEIKDCNCYTWGAMYLTAGTLTLQHCTVTNCHAKTYNASVIGVNGGSSVTIEDCDFKDIGNEASASDSNNRSGFMHVNSGSTAPVVVRRSRFWQGAFCRARLGGFSAVQAGASLTFEDCEFYDFETGNTGCDITKQASGAACIYTAGTSDVKIENCTFADNLPHGNSSNISPLSPTSSTAKNYVKNCIFWNNKDQAGEGTLRVTSSTGNTVFENCVADVSGLTGVTSVSASPFVDAENGDYTLAKTVSDGQGGRRANPCLGAGVKLDWMTAESLDLAGHPRMREKDLVDLGCYEYFRETPGFSIFVR